jgi:hypothetical protein
VLVLDAGLEKNLTSAGSTIAVDNGFREGLKSS